MGTSWNLFQLCNAVVEGDHEKFSTANVVPGTKTHGFRQ